MLKVAQVDPNSAGPSQDRPYELTHLPFDGLICWLLNLFLFHGSGNFWRDRYTMLPQSLWFVLFIGEVLQLEFPLFATFALEMVMHSAIIMCSFLFSFFLTEFPETIERVMPIFYFQNLICFRFSWHCRKAIWNSEITVQQGQILCW